MEPEVTAQPHTYLPPVECAPWCEDGDGHPFAFGVSDQACWSPAEYVDFAQQRPYVQEDGQVFPQQIGIMARAVPGEPAHVYLHLNNIELRNRSIPWPHNVLDHDIRVTPNEAEELARVLFRYSEIARSTPGDDG